MMRYLLYVFQIIRARLTKQRIPILVTLCVTNRCNLKCTYCYEQYYDRSHREFSTEELLQLVENLAELGTRYISINGGEALLRKDIEVIVDRIIEKNILCHLSTNGLLVKHNLSLLKKVDSIAISIDGYEQENDHNRGGGSYKKIIEGLEFLRAHKIKFHTHTVLTKNNKNAIDDILEIAARYKCDAQLSLLRKEDSPDKNIGLNDEEMKNVIRKILFYKKEGYPIFFSSKAYENFLHWPVSYDTQTINGKPPKRFRPIMCYIKHLSCHIEANGFVYPCVVLVNKIKAQNFIEVGFKRAWDNLSKNDCTACYNICTNDINLVFGLHPGAIANAVRIAIKRLSNKMFNK